MYVFKIRNKEGLYWEGHSSDKFTEEGKTWKKLNHVNSAITNALVVMFGNDKVEKYKNKDGFMLPNYLKECEIVKFKLVEKEVIKIK